MSILSCSFAKSRFYMLKNSHKINILSVSKLARIIKYYPPKRLLTSQTSRSYTKYKLGSQRVTVKPTCCHLFCYGQLLTMVIILPKLANWITYLQYNRWCCHDKYHYFCMVVHYIRHDLMNNFSPPNLAHSYKCSRRLRLYSYLKYTYNNFF